MDKKNPKKQLSFNYFHCSFKSPVKVDIAYFLFLVFQILELPTIPECLTPDSSDLDETNMEVTLTADKNLVTSQGLALSQALSQGLFSSQGQLITVNSGDLLNIQVSTNGILPTSNGIPIVNGSLLATSTATVTSPTTTR